MFAANDADDFINACLSMLIVTLGCVKLVVEDSSCEVVNDETVHHELIYLVEYINGMNCRFWIILTLRFETLTALRCFVSGPCIWNSHSVTQEPEINVAGHFFGVNVTAIDIAARSTTNKQH